jgi:hypothetical protein
MNHSRYGVLALLLVLLLGWSIPSLAETLIDPTYAFSIPREGGGGKQRAFLLRDRGNLLDFQNTVGEQVTVSVRDLNATDTKHLQFLRLHQTEKDAIKRQEAELIAAQQALMEERIAQEKKRNEETLRALDEIRATERMRQEEASRKATESQRANAAAEHAAELSAKAAELARQLLAFTVIRGNMNKMTDVQFKQYAASLKGQSVSWVGWVEEVTGKVFGGFECLVDMDPPSADFSVQDVTFSVSKEIAPQLIKNKSIQFTGTIESVLRVLGSCQVSLKDVTIHAN